MTKSCENCAFLRLADTNEIAYTMYACKKGNNVPCGMIGRMELKNRVCKKWKLKDTVLVSGDCFAINEINYLYCGKVGKFYKRYLVYRKNSFKLLKQDFLKDKTFVIYAYLPDYARKRREQWEKRCKHDDKAR